MMEYVGSYGSGKCVTRFLSKLCNVIVVIKIRRSLFRAKLNFSNFLHRSTPLRFLFFSLWLHFFETRIMLGIEISALMPSGMDVTRGALIKLITIIHKVELKLRHYQAWSRRMAKEQWRTGKGQELGVLYFPSCFEAKDARNNFAGRCGILHNVGRVLIKDLRYNQEDSLEEGKAR